MVEVVDMPKVIDAEKARQGRRAYMVWRVLLVSTLLAFLGMVLVWIYYSSSAPAP
jgi:hypothetical protein